MATYPPYNAAGSGHWTCNYAYPNMNIVAGDHAHINTHITIVQTEGSSSVTANANAGADPEQRSVMPSVRVQGPRSPPPPPPSNSPNGQREAVFPNLPILPRSEWPREMRDIIDQRVLRQSEDQSSVLDAINDRFGWARGQRITRRDFEMYLGMGSFARINDWLSQIDLGEPEPQVSFPATGSVPATLQAIPEEWYDEIAITSTDGSGGRANTTATGPESGSESEGEKSKAGQAKHWRDFVAEKSPDRSPLVNGWTKHRGKR
ncbi:MAG: hypothetical protein Q9162_004833 [Coniocarpon cinnabarinum]